MIVLLNILGSGMEGGVLRQLDDVEVVKADCRWIGHLHLEILQ